MEAERREPESEEPERRRGDEDADPDKVVPAEKTAPGVGEVEVGGESLDP